MDFDFAALVAPFRMQPGLSRMPDGAPNLSALDPGDRLFAEKLAALAHPEQTVLLAPDFDATPAAFAFAARLALDAPEHARLEGETLHLPRLDARIHIRSGELHLGPATPQGVQVALDRLAAEPLRRRWALFALAVREDLAVLDGSTTRLQVLSVCVPSHWAPEDKIGLPFAAAHMPVADNALLIKASESLARLVTGTERWQRNVWTFQPSPHFDGHPRRAAPRVWPLDAEPASLGDKLWARVEHQSFIPVPNAATAQAVFSIRLMIEPIEAAIATPEAAAATHAAVATMSEQVLAYRSLTRIQPGLLAWLAARARE
ncbi:hypothetical protein IP84_05940 [beta proteobacterium AAP99]|nr:hypothetical protein IP84_05940 [beta proteobacterium AAP99]